VSTKSAGKKAQRVDKECRQKVLAKGRSVPAKTDRAKKCSADKSTGKHRAFAQKKIKTKGERQQAWVI